MRRTTPTMRTYKPAEILEMESHEFVKLAREKASLSNREIGELLGVSRSCVEGWATHSDRASSRQMPRNERLLLALGVGLMTPSEFVPKVRDNNPFAELHEAFGETKPLVKWAADPRCVVAYQTLTNRLQYGWGLEEALTKPARKNGSPGEKHDRAARWYMEEPERTLLLTRPVPENALRLELSQGRVSVLRRLIRFSEGQAPKILKPNHWYLQEPKRSTILGSIKDAAESLGMPVSSIYRLRQKIRKAERKP